MQPKSAIHDLVADDFAALNTYIIDQLHSRVPLVEKIAEFGFSSQRVSLLT